MKLLFLLFFIGAYAKKLKDEAEFSEKLLQMTLDGMNVEDKKLFLNESVKTAGDLMRVCQAEDGISVLEILDCLAPLPHSSDEDHHDDDEGDEREDEDEEETRDKAKNA